MKLISSPDNKYVKLASSLKIRKYRDDKEMFLVEGQRAVEELAVRPDLVDMILVSAGNENEGTAPTSLDERKIIVESRLMKQICATDNPQGIAAIVRKPSWNWAQIIDRQGLLLYLDRIADPGNLGSILRTSWALGVDAVLLSKGCVDLFNPKVVRSTMGAILNLPVFTDVEIEQIEFLGQSGYIIMGTDASQGESYYRIKYQNPHLIIMGSEGQGIRDDLKHLCSQYVNIPIKPGVDSLNVAAACAIIVAEAQRQIREPI